ncbi:Uncharacterized protein C12G12.12 [Candida viswanathii]|uniref:Uncharacterized protein C12G12.12 n=1 Tax=Candida viswanathii TaxID=5486 RepID=A0A367XSX7_9ASCO|nr:Uncharacterized protein C12G12.12 [Candida viswanathii]
MGIGLYAIVAGTLITGAANSLLTKYQDNQCVENCGDPNPANHKNFNQPGIQTMQMFLGELGMYLVFLVYKWYNLRKEYIRLSQLEGEGEQVQETSIFQSFKLAVPAICDLSCTTLLNIGLIYTPVSIYQMSRGSVVLFVAILSVLFLKRKITKLEWISLFLVTLGIGIVGLSGSRNSKTSETSNGESAALVIFGIFLIISATLLQGFQFVIEEHILEKNPIIPLQLVYIEGFYGLSIMVILSVILNFIIGSIESPEDFKSSPFNLPLAFSQVFTNKNILISSILILLSIAAFNYCGLSITHRISATARSTVDTCRTLLVWIVAISMHWESFHLLQFTGFVVLVFGTLCFNGVLKPEEWEFVPSWLKNDTSNERLINVVDEIDEPIERM